MGISEQCPGKIFRERYNILEGEGLEEPQIWDMTEHALDGEKGDTCFHYPLTNEDRRMYNSYQWPCKLRSRKLYIKIYRMG